MVEGYATPLLVGDTICVFSRRGDLVFYLHDDGELIVAKASRSGLAPLKRYAVADSPAWAPPVLAGNRMLIRDATTVAMWTIE